MYGVREEVLGIQGHPEITEDIMLYLLNSTVRNVVPVRYNTYKPLISQKHLANQSIKLIS
jgi:hypothetical protein